MRRKTRQWKRIVILAMLCFTVLAPVALVSVRLKNFASSGKRDFIQDLSTIKYTTDVELKAIEEEEKGDLEEPKLVVFKEHDLDSAVSYRTSGASNQTEHSIDANNDAQQSSSAGDGANLLERNGTNHEITGDNQIRQGKGSSSSEEKLSEQAQAKQTTPRPRKNLKHSVRRGSDETVKEIRDQLIRAKAYLSFVPPGSKDHLVKELRTRIKDLDRTVGDATKDSDLSRRALQNFRAMNTTLAKATHVFPECSAMEMKLRAMTHNAEEQLRALKNQTSFLIQLAARSTPKGLHCLFMRLTAEYFALTPEERQLPNQQKVFDPDLYHYAVFSDNVLAAAVVVNSTVSSAMDAEKIIFHLVTDSLYFPAVSMWFLLNPPGRAAIHIQSIDDFEGLTEKYNTTFSMQNSHDPRFTSSLNHLRFYLPDVFPSLNKILFLDHDMVVQRDLTELWSLEMNGKVNGAVETCQENQPSFHHMDMFLNFSDPFVANSFDVKTCTWAFGLNLFDLQQWRRENLTALYNRYLQLGYERPLWMAGSLPLGWATFYGSTFSIDREWQLLGLGYESDVGLDEIEQAAALHYDGVMKPWLDIAIGKYKQYWSKYVYYDHPYLQQCNINE